MEQRRLGASGLAVPSVGMGTWKTFDVRGQGDELERRRVADAALETGINLFDSSPMYGEAERVLGLALEGRRDQAIVATKVWTADDALADEQIRRSLEFFGGRVEIYQVHNLVAWQTRLTQLERLRDEGKVQAVGITHYDHAAFADMGSIMRSGQVTMIQVPYNALDRAVEREVLPLAADLGIGVLIMRPLGFGALTARSPSPGELAPFAAFGVHTWAQVLLKWILSDARVSSVIPATRDPRHAADNARAGDPPWFGPAERDLVVSLASR